ncbi:MAG: hypothetical protein Q8R24_08355 [Legionellaceae bacterium]|nr:hypothetical protein [Legionellaceae bacterium]
MTSLNQEINNSSKDNPSELQLVLLIQRELKQSFPSAEFDQAVQRILLGMLYANHKETYDAHRKRMDALLNQLRPIANAEQATHINNSSAYVQTLSKIRRNYLQTTPGLIRFWFNERWGGLNFLFLILPLIVGAVYTPVGIAVLIFIIISTTFDVVNFSRKSRDYLGWSDEKPLGRQPLTPDERSTLEQTYGVDTVKAFHLLSTSKVEEEMSTTMYATYVVAFALSLIALAAFLFPPIGIPALALLLLTALAIGISVYQVGTVYNKRLVELDNIKQRNDSIASEILQDTVKIKALNKDPVEIDVRSSKDNPVIIDNSFLNSKNWYNVPNSNKSPQAKNRNNNHHSSSSIVDTKKPDETNGPTEEEGDNHEPDSRKVFKS